MFGYYIYLRLKFTLSKNTMPDSPQQQKPKSSRTNIVVLNIIETAQPLKIAQIHNKHANDMRKLSFYNALQSQNPHSSKSKASGESGFDANGERTKPLWDKHSFS